MFDTSGCQHLLLLLHTISGSKSSKRQMKAEQRNAKKFFDKWGGMPIFDQYGMIKGVTNG